MHHLEHTVTTSNITSEVRDTENNSAEALRNELLRKATLLCRRVGLMVGDNPRIPALLSIISSHACEREIDFLLQNQTKLQQWQKFDSYYQQKSTYATQVIVDHLKSELVKKGFNAKISTESRDAYGTYDVEIRLGNPCTILHRGREKIKIEIKGAVGLQIEQIVRYILDPSTLVIVRVLTNQVMMIRSDELEDFLQFTVDSMIKKLDRLLDNKFWTLQGNYCRNCGDYGCTYNVNRSKTAEDEAKQFTLVSMSPRQFDWDLRTFLGNLRNVAETASKLVIAELVRQSEHNERGV